MAVGASRQEDRTRRHLASSTDESSGMPSNEHRGAASRERPEQRDHGKIERRATLQHQEHAEREDCGRRRRHAECRRPWPAMTRKPAEQRIGHQREQTKKQAAPAEDIRPEAEAATAADRDRSEQHALECEQRGKAERGKIDLKEVHQVVGNAVPQPKDGQNGEARCVHPPPAAAVPETARGCRGHRRPPAPARSCCCRSRRGRNRRLP